MHRSRYPGPEILFDVVAREQHDREMESAIYMLSDGLLASSQTVRTPMPS